MGTFWQELYKSDLQSVWALWVVPVFFLGFLAFGSRSGPAQKSPVLPGAESFVRGWAWFFCLGTILDPFATGPLTRWAGVGEGPLGLAVLLFFVLLGDFRVFFLVMGLSQKTRPLAHLSMRSAVWTLMVPIAALAENRILTSAKGELSSQAIWLIYEICFVVMTIVLAKLILPGRAREAELPTLPYLIEILQYVAVYYALWAAADVLILAFGLDIGWALRIVPNQLYYSFFVPFAYWRFFARR